MHYLHYFIRVVFLVFPTLVGVGFTTLPLAGSRLTPCAFVVLPAGGARSCLLLCPSFRFLPFVFNAGVPNLSRGSCHIWTAAAGVGHENLRKDL